MGPVSSGMDAIRWYVNPTGLKFHVRSPRFSDGKLVGNAMEVADCLPLLQRISVYAALTKANPRSAAAA